MRALTVAAFISLGLPALPPLSYAAEAGKTVYATRCQGCHGADGKGVAAMAKALQAAIPDLTSKEVRNKPDKELLAVISNGKGKMPPTAGVSEKELKEVLSYVKSLSRGK